MKKTFLRVVCVVLAAASVIIILTNKRNVYKPEFLEKDKVEVIDPNTIILNDSGVRVSFSEVILSPKNETRKLVVFEQNATVKVKLEKSMIEKINWDVLTKSQEVQYTSTGHFVVDLDNLTEENIKVDDKERIVTIYIEHPRLDSINIDPDKIVVGKQKSGLLAQGKLKMTVQDYNEIEKTILEKFDEEFNTSANGQEADDDALKAVKEIYEPLIKAVDSRYKLEIAFK